MDDKARAAAAEAAREAATAAEAASKAAAAAAAAREAAGTAEEAEERANAAATAVENAAKHAAPGNAAAAAATATAAKNAAEEAETARQRAVAELEAAEEAAQKAATEAATAATADKKAAEEAKNNRTAKAEAAAGEAKAAAKAAATHAGNAERAAGNAQAAAGNAAAAEAAAGGGGDGKETPPGDANLPSSILLEPPDPKAVQLSRTYDPPTHDQILWAVIKDRTQAVQFSFYKEFMDRVLLSALGKIEDKDAKREWGALERIVDRVNAYDVLTVATELFMMAECGLVPEEAELTKKLRFLERKQPGTLTALSERQPAYDKDVAQLKEEYLTELSRSPEAQVLPYYGLIIERLEDQPNKPELVSGGAYSYGILRDAATNPPMIELIWSYWHEQGMLVQSMAAIATRFENRRMGSPDPLANLNLDPLRGANNLIWGWIQQEPSRLTVRRRAYEYDHQYGLSLFGRAVPRIDAADSRSKFLRCFHELLGLCVKFYEADDDTTVVADPFPVLNALKEVHMVLAEGAHNQFGDLPWTSRVEMMIMQWILARPEFREYLGGRTMVPYEETWMDRVDSMRQLQGWGDTSVSQFRDLGVYGEQILLSIRYGNWMTNSTVARAANWARTWREHIQVYIHAYRTVTSVDLTAEPVDARAAEARFQQPSAYLRQQEVARTRRALPAVARHA